MADDDAGPPAAKPKPRAKDPGAPEKPSGGRETGPFDGLHAPGFPVRDPNDPLSPERLRNSELSAEQAIHAYKMLVRIAKNPRSDPSYPYIIGRVRELEKQYVLLNHLAQVEYESELKRKEMISKLDMTKLENINALTEAEKAVGAAWLTWKTVHDTYRELYACESGSKPLPKGTPRAPSSRS